MMHPLDIAKIMLWEENLKPEPLLIAPIENRRAFRARMGSRKKAKARAGTPHSLPTFVAICRRADGTGRRYFTCRTHDQALQHGPYLIEHVNGWGQVTRRERFTTEARDAA